MDFIKRVKWCLGPKEPGPFVSAIIVAAGHSERMGTGRSKQLIPLGGIAAIARTLSAFEKSPLISEVIVVSNKIDIVRVGSIVKEFGFEKVSHIVVGGETRQKSVAIGLGAVNTEAVYVAVHDGARPLITPACIERVINGAEATGAAAAAVRVKDTVKVADENGIVVSTPDRQMLWAVQTPQVFSVELYRKALLAAQQSESDYTDDCQLIEAVGGHVQLIDGEYNNIKLTTVEDIAQAESVIRARGDAF